MRKTNYLGKGLWLLVIAGVIGYGVGLGIDLLVSSTLNFSGSVASAFALLLAVTAFFFRVYGYRGITRGLTWRVVGTLLGALFITGMARWSRTSVGGTRRGCAQTARRSLRPTR